MSLWTIQYVDGGGATQEVSFAALAALEGGKVVSDAWQPKFCSHRASSISLRLPGVPPHIAPVIPFESRVQIYSGRSGSSGSYTGGTKQFDGLRTDREGTADPSKPSSSYLFEDEFYFLEHLPFYQTWKQVTNAGTGASVNLPFTNIVLFQPNPGQTYSPAPVGNRITTGQQIVDILNWAISMGANLQVGTIDPAFYCAVYPIQNVRCADAIRHCLRLHPDCFTEIDYTTTPPTFNVRQRANLTSLTLPYAYTDSSGRRHKATGIKPLPKLRPLRVALFYRVISSGYLLSTPLDIWPQQNLSVTGLVNIGNLVGGASAPYTAGGLPTKGTAMAANPSGTATILCGYPCGLHALDFAIDLSGPKMSVSNAALTSAIFDPTSLAWWRLKVPSLQVGIPPSGAGSLALLSATINGGGATDITVLDETGTAVNLSTFGYVLDPKSSPMAWMTAPGGGALQVIEATVTAHFNYSKVKALGSGSVIIQKPNDHVHHVRVKLCNSPSVAQSYTQYITTGEAIPANLAQNVFTALNWLQYELTHELVEKPFNGWIKPGKHAINLAGGATAWATMNATLQTTNYRMHLDGAGNTFDNFTLKCGPVSFLEPGQLVQLFNVFANRDLARMDANERLSGLPSPGNTVAMPNDAAQENSITGQPDEGLKVFSAADALDGSRTNVFQHDPASGAMTMQQLKSADATIYTTGKIAPRYSGAGAPSSSTLATYAYYRVEDSYRDTTNNQIYVCTTAGDKTSSAWSASGAGLPVWI